jgi:RNA polymerase-binding protein DksA
MRWRISCSASIHESQSPGKGPSPVNQIVRQAQKALSDRRGALLRVWRQTADEEQQFSGAAETDWTDVASDREASEVLHALSDKERRELKEIEAALARIADGTYGLCERCGRAIGRQRLLAIPEARFCLECAA